MKLPEIITRMRHRAGFGVHSPFAFKLVTDAMWVNPRYRYYGEDDIDAMDYPRGIRYMMRIVYRVIAYLGVRKISVPAQGSPLIEAMAPLADATVLATSKPDAEADMVIDLTASFPIEELANYLRQPYKSVWRVMRPGTDSDTLPGDLIFLFRDAFLAFSRPGMARTLYKV